MDDPGRSESGPVGRWGHTLIYDPVYQRLLVIGGRDDRGTVRATSGVTIWRATPGRCRSERTSSALGGAAARPRMVRASLLRGRIR